MRRKAKRGRALRRLLPLAFLLSAFLVAPTEAQTPPTSYVVEGGVGAMAMGPDSTLWFASYNRLGRIKPDGSFEIVGEVPRGYEGDFTVDPDGNLWLASTWVAPTPGLMRVSPTGERAVFPLPEELGEVGELIVGPGGIWLTSWRRQNEARGALRGTGPAYLSRVAPDGGVAKFKLPGPSKWSITTPGGIAVGPDGNLWVADHALARINRVSPSGRIASFEVRNAPYSLTAGPGGSIWFISDDAMGRVSPAGKVTEFALPNGGGTSIVTGPDGNLWFGDHSHIGRMTPWGQVSSFWVGGANLSGLVPGRDRGIWIGTSANPIKHVLNGWIEKLPTGLPGVEIASRKAVVRGGRFALSLECGGSPTQGCAGKVRFGRGKKELVLSSYALAPESRGTVRLRLPAFAQRRLAGRRFWRGHFRVTVEDGLQASRGVVLQNPRFSR